MMLVIDASMAGPMVLPDEAPLPDIIVDRIAAGTILVPSHWALECVSMLHIAERRRRISRVDRMGAASRLRSLSVTVDQQTGHQAWTETSRLADDHGLTVYDAAYLELAIRASAALGTLDGDLRDAARACGVEVLTY